MSWWNKFKHFFNGTTEEDFETALNDLQNKKDDIEELRRDLATEQNKNYSPQTPTAATRSIELAIALEEEELNKLQKAYNKAEKAKKTAIKKVKNKNIFFRFLFLKRIDAKNKLAVWPEKNKSC